MVNPERPWSDPEGDPDPSGMTLMASPPGPRDHRGIAEAPESGSRPLPDGERPTEVLPVAPAPPGTEEAAETADLGRHDNGSSGDEAHAGWPGRRWGRGDWHHGHREHCPPHVGRRLRTLRRTEDSRVLGGVCGAVSRATGIDVTWVRVGCVLACIASGIMIFVYACAWLMIPMEGQSTNIYSRAIRDRRGIRLVLAVLLPVLILMQIITGSLHVPVLGFISWPTLLAAGLVVLIWRNANESERDFIDHEVVPLLGNDFHGTGRRLLVLRIVAGIAIGAIGIVLLVEGHTTFAALRPVGGAALVVAAAIIVFGPWWLSLVRDLIAERQARVRAEERAQMAAHVHDSVLQTLALIQRSADDPRTSCASPGVRSATCGPGCSRAGLPASSARMPPCSAKGSPCCSARWKRPTGSPCRWWSSATASWTRRCAPCSMRRARPRSTRPSGRADQVSVFAEVEPDTARIYVRDRGQGFDRASVPADRRGIAQSIEGRLERFGGQAVIRSAPGEGAEVQLSMPRRERVK